MTAGQWLISGELTDRMETFIETLVNGNVHVMGVHLNMDKQTWRGKILCKLKKCQYSLK